MPSIGFIREVGVARWATRYALRQFTKRILKRDSRMVLPTGAEIILPRQSGSATEVFVTKAKMDWGAEALFVRFANPNRDFLDIGAHIGYYALYLSPCVRKAYAFEPDPRNLPGLMANARLRDNVKVVEMAVSSRDGVGSLHIGQGSAVSSLEDGDGATIEVPTIRIDSFVAARPGLDVALIKTDVEGHDIEALRGMTHTVQRCQPLILTECSGTAELRGLCREWKYDIFAHVRSDPAASPILREMSDEMMRTQRYKMAFLVPPHLLAAFRQLAKPSR